MSENILEINNLSKYFGGLAAVSDCSIKVKRGTITGCLLYTSPSPRDGNVSRMPSSA